jgi:hypothetical protein
MNKKLNIIFEVDRSGEKALKNKRAFRWREKYKLKARVTKSPTK